MSNSQESIPDDPRYTAALEWLLGRINFERFAVVPYGERQFKLDRMRQLLTRLGNPDAGMKIVHVAGTKGKGSTSAMIASMLRCAGYSTGVYSSPHLHRLEERLAVDGVPCPAEEFVALIDRVRPIAELMDDEGDGAGPTYFELTTALALSHFADRQVDAVVLEVGLGGRLDSTNVCLPVVSVITSISRDHTKQLGNTLGAIAAEKAGIIKPGVPVISGVTGNSPRSVIAETAREHGCRLAEIGHDFYVNYRSPRSTAQTTEAANLFGQIDFRCNVGGQQFELNNAKLALLGQHQAANAAAALATVVELQHQGWSISPEAMREGLANTRLPARIEIISGTPTSIIDTAHNGASASALAQTVEECFPRRFSKMARWLVLSISRDKDAQEIVANLVPHFDHFVVTQFQENPRAIPADKLTDIVRKNLSDKQRETAVVETIAQPADAWQFTKDAAKENELITIAGSFFIAAELRAVVVKEIPRKFCTLDSHGDRCKN